MDEVTDCLSGLIEQQALHFPNRTAVISRAGHTSYRDLVARVDASADWLLGLGVTRGTRVAVCADRSLMWIVAALAVFRAGGVYIALDPLTPLARKARILEQNGVQLSIIESHLAMLMPQCAHVAVLDNDRIAKHPVRKLPLVSDQAAYGIYTSGSAGVPKSVIVSHGALTNYARVLRRELRLCETDRYLHTASIAFSASIRQLVAPLVSGAAMLIAAGDEIRDPSRLIAWMIEGGVTTFDTVPSYLVRWLAAVLDAPRDWRERLAGSFRQVLCTGEPLPCSGEVLACRLPGSSIVEPLRTDGNDWNGCHPRGSIDRAWPYSDRDGA